MSDNKDKDATEAPFDFDSTVRLDVDQFEGIDSVSSDVDSLDDIASISTGESTLDEFDTTLDGLQDIDELLNENTSPSSEADNPEQNSDTDTIDFDELNAGIEALSEDLLQPVDEPDDYVPEMTEKSEEMFDLELADLPGEDEEDENQLSVENLTPEVAETLSVETPDDELLESEAVEVEEETADSTDEVAGLTDTLPGEDDEDESQRPVEDSTPELDEPSEPEVVATEEEDSAPTDEDAGLLDDLAVQDVADDFDLPELTDDDNFQPETINDTSEKDRPDDESTEMTSDAVDEDNNDEEPVETPVQPAGRNIQDDNTPQSSGNSGKIPLLFGILGIAVGGFGAWLAFDATGKVANLEYRMQDMTSTDSSSLERDIADIQQRLNKVERRLTGTPTMEAAAPLGDASNMESDPQEAMDETAVQPEEMAIPEPVIEATVQPVPITPETPISPVASNGDWVVNISSHVKEDLAIKENERLKALGLSSEVHAAEVKGRKWYRVQIVGLADRDSAKAELNRVQQTANILDAWIGKK